MPKRHPGDPPAAGGGRRVTDGPLYAYGVAAEDAEIDLPALGEGLGGTAPSLLPAGRLLVLVGQAPPPPLEPTRRNMLAHTAVLERALAQADVLPFSFGTVAPDLATLRRGLASTENLLLNALSGVAGRVELGVKATWREGVAWREILDRDPALRAMRDRLRTARPNADTYHERIELGRRVEAALNARREAEAAAILAELAPLAERSATLRLLDDGMVLNRAFLVRRAEEPRFDAAMQRLADRHGERMDFRYVGPVPAYNFVSLRADWLAAAA
nr:GvpL/GvpF family gas vesicle protein [Paracraurococcus ruber]